MPVIVSAVALPSRPKDRLPREAALEIDRFLGDRGTPVILDRGVAEIWLGHGERDEFGAFPSHNGASMILPRIWRTSPGATSETLIALQE
jgi:hypothetical protein